MTVGIHMYIHIIIEISNINFTAVYFEKNTDKEIASSVPVNFHQEDYI